MPILYQNSFYGVAGIGQINTPQNFSSTSYVRGGGTLLTSEIFTYVASKTGIFVTLAVGLFCIGNNFFLVFGVVDHESDIITSNTVFPHENWNSDWAKLQAKYTGGHAAVKIQHTFS